MYSDWDAKTETIANRLNWYRVDDLIEFVHQICEFVIKSMGKMSDSYAPKLAVSRCPAQYNVRFPAEELYVCEGTGNWSFRINTLLLSLSLVLYPNKLQRKYIDINTPGDAEMTLLTAASEILFCIEQMHDLFDRGTFENRYAVQWNESEN
ncbi:hypothetical protein BDB00DRAFT_877131 [Zychaea mexicana]|uniref:uncharacterized protein n=1 Tax=Zychaea mexicana TaxID=64656 RepID=UPI0022FDD66A|nr:uncharacterized protein BDB00DRAFT_877131 [Zychaea mexicana]KAI9488774.1 hypothetical protein BDB00DRAFT_877131 [Zychaea mexicana]